MSALRKEVQYMGNNILIKDRRVCVKSLQSILEVIKKLKPPITVVEGCRRLQEWYIS